MGGPAGQNKESLACIAKLILFTGNLINLRAHTRLASLQLHRYSDLIKHIESHLQVGPLMVISSSRHTSLWAIKWLGLSFSSYVVQGLISWTSTCCFVYTIFNQLSTLAEENSGN
ncbi:hypothetical protein GIB67_024049 [Kingdonia uniflora]|uniref:Uncharacterized protein n=1 Tax=Kingdonia uniflora TaxID=39325 RepID=A0A7J7LB48_9MAGN|nr:hypothetical protein GIB67_024049 [Kingdonia uniflora]